eukprot:UN33683
MFPSKCRIIQKKTGGKQLLYSIVLKGETNEGEALFFSPTPKHGEKIFPTLSILWQYPDFCTTYYIDSHICRFIFRGASLFLAGIDQALSEWENVDIGQPACIKVVGNQYPIAIGSILKSTAEIRKQVFVIEEFMCITIMGINYGKYQVLKFLMNVFKKKWF